MQKADRACVERRGRRTIGVDDNSSTAHTRVIDN